MGKDSSNATMVYRQYISGSNVVPVRTSFTYVCALPELRKSITTRLTLVPPPLLTQQALIVHFPSIMHLSCSDCNREFDSASALHAHCRDKDDHAYCVDCERLFSSENSLQQHLRHSTQHDNSDEDDDEVDDDDAPHCTSCNRDFKDANALHSHLSNSEKHNWCFQCSKDFNNAHALQQHQNSTQVHNTASFYCPLCGAGFKLLSAVAAHVESSTCKRSADGHQITPAVTISYGLHP